MKKTAKLTVKFIALLCSAITAFSLLSLSAGAEDRILPSGMPFDKIGSTIEQKVTINDSDPNAPDMFSSLETVVFCGDEILYTGCFGEIDREKHIPADEESVYEWGSISKTMIWVSVMQLWEQGKLDLDADIRTYLPDGFFRYLSYDDPITMMNLMNHEGGWCETTYSMGTDNESEILSLEEALRSLEPAQTYRPGEVTAYSNWGAALAAYIVESVSGMGYTEYVHQNILDKLGLEHTAVSSNHRDNEWVRQQREKLISYKFNIFPETVYKPLGNCMSYILLYPAGSVTGTIGDLAKYAQAFVDDSHPLFRNRETQEKLFSGSAFYGNSAIPSSSYGFGVTEFAVRTFGHDGATVSGVSSMLFDPESKVGTVMLTNEPAGNIMLELIPYWIFGKLSPDKYSDGNNEPFSPEGYYLLSRSNAAGILKFNRYLFVIPGERMKNISKTADELYQVVDDETAMLLGGKLRNDGTISFSSGSVEYMPEKMYILKLGALTLFFMIAVVSVFILLIKLKIRKSGKVHHYNGAGILTAGQIAKVISMFSIVVLTAFVSIESSYGLPKTVGFSIGIIQMTCMATCILAAGISIYSLSAKKQDNLGKLRYVCNIAGNAVAIFVIAFFEMYKFWGC